jgi:hypothetical protein
MWVNAFEGTLQFLSTAIYILLRRNLFGYSVDKTFKASVASRADVYSIIVCIHSLWKSLVYGTLCVIQYAKSWQVAHISAIVCEGNFKI